MTARVAACCLAIGVLAAPIGGRAAHRPPPTDRVIVNVPASAAPVLLFSGWRNGTCDQFVVVTALDNVGDASHAGTPDCPASLVVFARGYTPAVVSNPQWDAGAGGSVVSVDLVPATVVDVVSWVITDAAQIPATFAATLLTSANATLDDERTGIVLRNAGIRQMKRSDNDLASVIGQGCARVDQIRSNSQVYVPGKLNVYYVVRITKTTPSEGINRAEVESSYMGYNCGALGAPEIIFINYQSGGPGTLLHEVGHALGSWEPEHPTLKDNVMQSGWKLEGGRIALGQAYRMHFGSWSWLNRAEVFSSRPLVTTCQVQAASDWPCPALSRRPPS